MQVFISHLSEESRLAGAWKELLRRISHGAVRAWYASDREAGLPAGASWDEHVAPRLSEANFVLAILTPRSAEQPWILWECGIARGQQKQGIVPLLFACSPGGPFAGLPARRGDDREEVVTLCRLILRAAGLSEPVTKDWEPALDAYFETIRLTLHSLRAMRKLLPEGRWGPAALPADERQNPWAAFEVHSRLSAEQLEQERYAPALAAVDKALALVPDDPVLLHRRGLILLGLGRLEEAKRMLSRIQRIEPGTRYDPEIAGFAGRLHRQFWEQSGDRSHLKTAIAIYRRAYERHPDDCYTGANVAALSQIYGDTRTAQEVARILAPLCRELQQQESATFWVDFTLGELYLIMGEVGRAFAEYRRGLGRAPRPAPRDLAAARERVTRLLAGGPELEPFAALLS